MKITTLYEKRHYGKSDAEVLENYFGKSEVSDYIDALEILPETEDFEYNEETCFIFAWPDENVEIGILKMKGKFYLVEWVRSTDRSPWVLGALVLLTHRVPGEGLLREAVDIIDTYEA